ncbi:MAG: hypothetical protein BWX68_02950 [Verrucomicrobia bacterium ADurb.Bin063]|nr:MAG: hypothetical protein BWX68_02950 [Verrucomicrobia bacterium ADurb.Bin063]
MGAQGGQPHLFQATARRRVEYLPRRPGGGERDRQGVSRAQAGRGARHRPPHAARPRGGGRPRGGAAHEHLFQAVPGLAGAVSLGVRADHPLRSDPDRQMVLRELQRDELLEPLDVRAAGDHQSFQAHPQTEERGQTGRALPGGHPRTRPGAGARPGTDYVAQLLSLAGPGAQVRGMVRAARNPSLPQAGVAQGRTVDAGTVRGVGWPGGDLPGDAQFPHRPQSAGLPGRPPAGGAGGGGIKETRARNRAERPHRALPVAGLGYCHCQHLSA